MSLSSTAMVMTTIEDGNVSAVLLKSDSPTTATTATTATATCEAPECNVLLSSSVMMEEQDEETEKDKNNVTKDESTETPPGLVEKTNENSVTVMGSDNSSSSSSDDAADLIPKTSTTTTKNDTTATAMANVLTQGESQRLKFLLKRATYVPPGNSNSKGQQSATTDVTGITSQADWHDLMNLWKRYEYHYRLRGNNSNNNKSSKEKIATNNRDDQDKDNVGILSKQCHNNSQLGPSIRWRNPSKNYSCLTSSQHRDLLHRLVFLQSLATTTTATTTTSSGGGNDKGGEVDDDDCCHNHDNKRKLDKKKRKRELRAAEQQLSQQIPLPAWVTIHNPGAVEHVAVLELHVPLHNNSKSTQMKLEDWKELITQACQKHDKHCLAASGSVEWFPETRHAVRFPKSITEALLYKPNPKPPRLDKKKEHARDGIHNLDDLYEALQELVLSYEQFQREGYPLPVVSPAHDSITIDDDNDKKEKETATDLDTATDMSDTKIVQPSQISLEDARQFLEPYHVTHLVGDQDQSTTTTTTQGTAAAATTTTISTVASAKSSSRPLLPPFVARTAAGPPDANSSTTTKPTSSTSGRIFAMDCEMVQTTEGSELARITLVQVTSLNLASLSSLQQSSPKRGKMDYKRRKDGQQHGHGSSGRSHTDHEKASPSLVETVVVFDELVKPYNRIVDYVTQFSGMTAALLNPVTTRLEQVQAALLQTVHANDIVIGHSLENDLIATRWCHNQVVDTSVLFRPPHGRHKYSLKNLAAQLLHVHIREDKNKSGNSAMGRHCSEEDAVTALQLAVRRAVQGPSFDAHDKSQSNQLSALAAAAAAGNRTNSSSSSTSSSSNATVCVGPADWLRRHVTNQPNAIHALTCENIRDGNTKAVAAWLTGPKRRARFVYAQWTLTTQADVEYFVSSVLEDLLQKMITSHTILAVAVQSGYAEVQNLSQERRIRQNPMATVAWTDAEEAAWSIMMDQCRKGSLFWIGGGGNGSTNISGVVVGAEK